MGLALAISFEKVRDRIKDSGSFWVDGLYGWYHTFNKKKVQQRLIQLNLEIAWHRKQTLKSSKWQWEPIAGTSNT